MSSFIQAFSDGFTVVGENWQLVLASLAVILVSQLIVYDVLRPILGDQLRGEDYFSLSIAGWILPALFLAIVWYGLRIVILPDLTAGFLLFMLAIFAVLLYRRVHGRHAQVASHSLVATLCLLAFLCISAVLRLAFVSGLLLPQYFDSTRHYMLINSILGHLEPGANLTWSTTDYYHVGFHFLTAFITSIPNVNISQTMLVLGQVVVTLMPVSVFFLIKYETQSNSAGLFTVLLAGFGWSMPAYALNWGKYPALTSLALLPFVLSMAYLAAHHRNEWTKRHKWILYAMLACATASCGLLHSRSLVVVAIALVAWIMAGRWQALPTGPRFLLLGVLLLGILFVGLFIQRQEVLEPLFNPYAHGGIYVTLMVLFLTIFAQKVQPALTFANIVAIFFLLCALFIPTVNWIPRLTDLTLLDRTFVEMLLYLPLSLLGGLGLAGLTQTLKAARWARSNGRRRRGEYIGAVFIMLLIGNTILQYDFQPSDCCTIVSRDDLTAMDWIRVNLPEKARILIAAEELTVLASGQPQGFALVDAGAWITPLTGRTSVPFLYDIDLSRPRRFEAVCKLGVDYIYIGGVGLSFHAPRLRAQPEWYTPVLSLSRVEVYQVSGCR